MKARTLFVSCVLSILISNFNPLQANPIPDGDTTPTLYNSALNAHVKQLLSKFGKNGIERERFLVQQIRMINAEIKTKITGVAEIRDNYFDRLGSRLGEVRALKSRIAKSESSSLLMFVGEVESKIQQAMDAGTIDYKRQRVIEDAVQLLYIAEEMTKLDPNARLEEDPEFAEDFNKTKSGFMQSFGEELKINGFSRSETSGGKATIFDVYREWKRNERLKFHVRWTDIQIIKNRLIRNGSASDRERMFKRELRQAAEMYNFGFYDLAERSFAEILSRYTFIGRLDDCLYYKGESNVALGRFNKAQIDFSNFLEKFPSSPFLKDVYKRQIQISYHFSEFNRVVSTYEDLRYMPDVGVTELDEITLSVCASAIKVGNYEKAAEYAEVISPESVYFRQARFLLGEAYAGTGNFTEAQQIFLSIAQTPGIDPDFRFTLMLKLGYISYELGDYPAALNYFDQIGGNFGQYDRVLIGYGWTYYKMELAKGEYAQKDFTYARKNLELLVDYFFGSDYLLEGRTLLGYINQLEMRGTQALNDFGYVFNAKEVNQQSDVLNAERERLARVMAEAKQLEEKAFEAEDAGAFERAYKMRRKIRGPLNELTYMDLSTTGVAAKNEMKRLNNKLGELDALKAKAKEKNNKRLVERIDLLQLKIYRAVNMMSTPKRSKLGVNYFDEHPIARKASVVKNENQKISALRSETKEQRAEINSRIAELDVQIEAAKSRRDYRRVIGLELSRERFEDLAKKLDYLETKSFGLEVREDNINLDKWSDYGAFGLTNVQFAIKNAKADEIGRIQSQIDEINTFLNLRKGNIEHKIDQINNEITVMTRRVREQERMREREELKQRFEESYFDTHDTEMEFNLDQTQTENNQDEQD